MSEIQRGFVIFSTIYIPVSILFINNSSFAEILLIVYTSLLIIAGILLIWTIALQIGDFLDEPYSSKLLIQRFFVNLFAPLVMFKIFAYVIIEILPTKHEGILCDIRYFILDMYELFDVQNTLNWIILGSIASLITLLATSVFKNFRP